MTYRVITYLVDHAGSPTEERELVDMIELESPLDLKNGGIGVLHLIDDYRESQKPATRSQEDLARLKANWKADPCYDLEDVDGFGAHRTELLIFRLEQEKAWLEQRMKPLEELRRQLRDVLGVTPIEQRVRECLPEVR